MTYFWDYIFIPLLVTLGLHALIIYFVATAVKVDHYDITPTPEMEFVEATLVEIPQEKKAPKTRQPKAAPKPKVEQLATPKAIPQAGDIPVFDQDGQADTDVVEDDFPLELSTLFETLEEEEMLLQEETDNEVIAKYVTVIRKMIEAKWSRPPSARNGMEVLLAIVMLPSGEVVNVTVTKTSGNAAFDESAVKAVKAVNRFSPITKIEARLFEDNFRELNLLFRPEDLLL